MLGRTEGDSKPIGESGRMKGESSERRDIRDEKKRTGASTLSEEVGISVSSGDTSHKCVNTFIQIEELDILTIVRGPLRMVLGPSTQTKQSSRRRHLGIIRIGGGGKTAATPGELFYSPLHRASYEAA